MLYGVQALWDTFVILSYNPPAYLFVVCGKGSLRVLGQSVLRVVKIVKPFGGKLVIWGSPNQLDLTWLVKMVKVLNPSHAFK